MRCQIGISSLVTVIDVTCPTFSLSKRVSRVCLPAPGGESPAHFRGVGIFNLLVEGECLFGVLAAVLALLERIRTGPLEGKGPPHPLFGPLTRREWGVATYKHTDHHLKQFGA